MKKKTFIIPAESATGRNKEFLNYLANTCSCKNRERAGLIETIIKNATTDEFNGIIEIVRNFLSGIHPKTNRQFVTKMRPYKRVLRKLNSPKLNKRTKKQLLIQSVTKKPMKGGFFPLASLILPVLSTIAAPIIQHFIK